MQHRLLALAAVACLLAAPSAAAPSVDGFTWQVAPTAETYRLAAPVEAPGVGMAELQRSLAAREVGIAAANPLRIAVSPADWESVVAGAPAAERRYRVGLAKEVGLAVDFSALRPSELRRRGQALTFGAIAGSRKAGYVWTGVVEAPGATALRLHLAGLDLPRGAELFVYNHRGQAFGPYSSRGPAASGEMWTHTVFGDRMIVQLRQAGPVTRNELGATKMVVASVGVMGERFRIGAADEVRWQIANGLLDAAGYCPDNADCVVGDCQTTSNVVATARDAVAHMLFQSGGFYYICSGGLLADTGQSGTPYFLTANHCISKGREANSLETYFNYDDPSCSCPNPPYRNYTTLGASILSSNRTSDYTLMQLDSTPSGAAYLGWDANPVAFSHGTALYRISHPSGVPQAYSEHSVDTQKGTCSSWPRGSWIYSKDTLGATEGGSSGSPVLNAAGKVVGQLSGACGTNVNDNCDPINNATVDGALAAYFGDVAQWLDGGGGCVPEPEVCDGVDNDCDGLVDEGDVCGGSCSPAGAACSANSECCSSKCRGKSGSKTCR